MSFDYLINKIADAKIETVPFRHLYINDVFDNEHFSQIVSAPEVLLPQAESDARLFDIMFDKHYKIIDFPGCITDRNLYIKWHKNKKADSSHTNSSCEGFGMTLRLMKPSSSIVTELFEFMHSGEFQESLAAKFAIGLNETFYDAGIQKYLDGYEISPHPDGRTKALTYMVNINPGANSEARDHHTHYLRLRDEFRYIQTYWDGHPNEDRFWVPWSWCDSVKMQRENNSLVVFAPDNTTMHAVRANYGHLAFQRTQLYGNFWFKNKKFDAQPHWENYTIGSNGKYSSKGIRTRVKETLPVGLKQFIKTKILLTDKHVAANPAYVKLESRVLETPSKRSKGK
jgi:hypothetical protein